MFFVEILASKVVAQVIAQKFVPGKVALVYSLKLLYSGEFPRYAKFLDGISFHYNVYFFLSFSVFAFQPKQNVDVATRLGRQKYDQHGDKQTNFRGFLGMFSGR